MIKLSDLVIAFSHLFDRHHAKQIRPYLENLANLPNFHVWTFFHYYHGKTLDFDRKVVAIGSYNFDKASADLNYESALICEDEQLAQAQDRIYLQEEVNAEPVLPGQDSDDFLTRMIQQAILNHLLAFNTRTTLCSS